MRNPRSVSECRSVSKLEVGQTFGIYNISQVCYPSGVVRFLANLGKNLVISIYLVCEPHTAL